MSVYLNLPDGQMVPLRDGMIIGRVAAADIVVDDTKASRRHARLHLQGGIAEIEDLGSSNGTLLNGKPVQRRMLRDGDEVQIGSSVLVFTSSLLAAGGSASNAAPTPVAEAAAPPSPPSALVDDDEDVDLFGADVAAAPPPPHEPPVARKSVAGQSGAGQSEAGSSQAGAAAESDVEGRESRPAPADRGSIDTGELDTSGIDAAPTEQIKPATGPAPPKPGRPAGASPPRQVVEFADEVVSVRGGPSKAAPAAPRAAATGEPSVQVKQRTLQFARTAERSGPLGDDLAQLSGGMRLLVVACVLAGAVGVIWLMMTLVS